jgi:hypothetical protein
LREQVDVGVDLLYLAAEIDGLSNEISVRACVWIVEAKLVGLAAREPSGAVHVCETMALINFRIDPKLGSLPQSQADEHRNVKGFARFADAGQTFRIPEPGLPFSLVFRTEPGSEDILLRIASAYEAASKRRIPSPAFGPLAPDAELRDERDHRVPACGDSIIASSG